ncbi:MAG: galactose oxidase [Candidatus Rokubacteria bacterium]|nr:galactose oxidase [Candidatus Rokubacteria bacterium]
MKRGKAITGISLIVLVTLFVIPVSAQQRGKWSKAAPMAKGWEEVMGAAIKGKVYVYEGLQTFPRGYTGTATLPEWRPAGQIAVYDPAMDAWTLKSAMPVAAHHPAVAVHGDKLYFFGGFVSPDRLGGWSSVANVWMYDPEADKWTPKTPLPTPRGGAHAVEVGGKIYVIGGYTTAAHLPGLMGMDMGTTEEYDPATDAWRSRQPMPTPRNHHAIGTIGGKIYVAGGRIGGPFVFTAAHINVTEEYDPVRNLWTSKAAMPTPRSGLGYAVWGGKLFVFGGERAPTFVHGEVEAYDPATNRWESYASMPTPRHGPAVALVGNRIHVVAGNVRIAGGSQSPVHEVFEPEPPPAPAGAAPGR